VIPLRRVSIQGYRAARELAFEPGSICALVGEASSGKSTVLTAIWTLLEAAASPPTIDDVSRASESPEARSAKPTTPGGKAGTPAASRGGRIHLEADLGRSTIFLDARPPETLNLNRAGAPPVLFLPANLRSRTMVAPATGRGAADVAELLRPPSPDHHWAAADGGLALVTGMERLLASNLRRFVLLIEEPELYLSPHAQRHLYRILRRLAQHGNQILYSTHAPVFLSVDRLEELALVRHTDDEGTTLFQPEPLAEAESFRALSEFDSDRAELFLARCALLVEGRTEKLTFPLVFDALGIDPDQEGILVLECGGKGNIPLFVRICNACEIPYVVVHDRDAPKGERPLESERVVNRQIREVAGSRRTVVLTPDFEAVSGVKTSRSKPRKLWSRYRGTGEVPEPLKLAVEKVVRAARS
jgi:predicted ATP-dependent endonuclease of OLD family